MKRLGSLTGTLYGGSYLQPRELFTLTMPYGTERWTNASVPTTSGSFTFQPKVLTRFKRQEDDTDSEVKIEISSFETGSSGQTMIAMCLGGTFRNVPVRVERGYFSTSGTLLGAVTVFSGYMTKTDGKSTKVTLTVASGRSRLHQEIPDRGIQASCPWFGFDDPRCGLGTNCTTNTLAAGVSAINLTVSSSPATYQNMSKVTITSGPLSGSVRYIQSVNVPKSVINLTTALPYAPASGTTITVGRTCDRTRATCRTLGNIVNFGGVPDMPLSSST